MQIKRFSIVLAVAALTASAANAAPPRAAELPAVADAAIVLVQSVKERDLEAVPPVDAGRAPPATYRAGPPAPPPVPPAPRLTTRAAPPPAADDDAPPAREMPPPPTSTSRYTAPPPPPTSTSRYTPPPPAPPRAQEPAYRPAPRTDEPPPPPAAAAPRRAPPTRSAFYANCTQQCHLSCEASFEACNGDSSPAKAACVKKLETCRVERCACRFD